jgi:hypothetical protein
MFTCENIQYVIEASDTLGIKELVSKQQTFQDMIASYNKNKMNKKKPKRFSIS